MPAAWIAAGGALLGAMGGGASQGGTTTAKNEPWAAAQPWLQNNLQTGQNLQSHYQRNPFNAQQQAAYGNLASGTDFINQLTPGLLQQFSQPGGFDRNNPQAKPAPFSFFEPQGQSQGQAQAKPAPFSFFEPQGQSQGQPQGYGGMMQPSAPQASAQPAAQAPAIPKPQGAFDGAAYLKANPDVQSNWKYWNNPQQHYLDYGKSEGRAYTEMGA